MIFSKSDLFSIFTACIKTPDDIVEQLNKLDVWSCRLLARILRCFKPCSIYEMNEKRNMNFAKILDPFLCAKHSKSEENPSNQALNYMIKEIDETFTVNMPEENEEICGFSVINNRFR